MFKIQILRFPSHCSKKPKRCFPDRLSKSPKGDSSWKNLACVRTWDNVVWNYRGYSISPKCASSSIGEFNEPKMCFQLDQSVLPITAKMIYATESDSAPMIVCWTRPYFAKIQDLGPFDLDHLEFFQFDETLNIFSYRADTSIPATIVSIGVGGQKLVAYLKVEYELFLITFSSSENIFSSSSSWRPCDFPYKLSLICKGISPKITQNRPPPTLVSSKKYFPVKKNVLFFFFSRTTRSLLSFPLL